MKLNLEEVKSLNDLIKSPDMGTEALRIICRDLIDTAESLQQEIKDHITWNEVHTKARVDQAQKIKRLQAERDAAIEDLRRYPGQWPCHVCKHEGRPSMINGKRDETWPCKLTRDCFEWRGLERIGEDGSW